MSSRPGAPLVAVLAAAVAAGCLSFHPAPPPGAPAGSRFAEIDGVRLRYVDRGTGPAVVLVHGFGASLATWDGVAAALAGTHRVIALDLKGFGWSGRPPGDYSPEAQARLVLGLLDALGVDRAAFVGHSWGASIVLAVALAAPARVDRVALYAAWAYEAQLPTFTVFSRAPGVGEALFGLFWSERAGERARFAFHDAAFVTEAMVEDIERSATRPGTRAAALAAARGQRYRALEPRYRTIERPVLLLWGRDDRVSTPRFGERLARDLPHARLVTFPACGHFPMIEAAAASTSELAHFLAEPAAEPAPGPAPASAPASEAVPEAGE